MNAIASASQSAVCKLSESPCSAALEQSQDERRRLALLEWRHEGSDGAAMGRDGAA